MNYSFDDIVITGCSAVTAAGSGLEHVLAMRASGADALSDVPGDIRGSHGQRWGRATGFKASDFIPPLKARKLDRCSQFAVAASGLALKNAGIDPKSIPAERIGIALGCGFGGVPNSAEFLSGYFASGVEGMAPMLFPNTVSNAPASNVSIEFGLKGPNVSLVQRFCSAESAFLMACRFIADGRADIMLTGGADDLLPLMITAFSDMRQLQGHARHFGEGCGVLVLEHARHAAQRGAISHAAVKNISSVGLLTRDDEQAGIKRLLNDTGNCSFFSLSGTVTEIPGIMEQLPASAAIIDLSGIVGRSLAMGGTVMAALVSSLENGQHGQHLAASPEGPYYAVRFIGGASV